MFLHAYKQKFFLKIILSVFLRWSRKQSLTAVGICCADHATPYICKSWHYLRRKVAVARSV
jgi:hypothetical protein